MATIIFGEGIKAASGSIGGTTYSHNRYGPYIRTRSVPVNPSSDRQQAVRAAFQDAAEQWSGTLTQLQRDAWDQYAANIVMKGALGQDVFITGYNHFMRSNVALLQALDVIIADGPTVLTLPEADSVFSCEVDETNQQISVAFDDTKAWLDENGGFMFISMSQPRGAGRSFIGGPYRLAGYLTGDSITPPTTPTVLGAPFQVATGQKVVCEGRIMRADGRLSEPFRHTSTVVA